MRVKEHRWIAKTIHAVRKEVARTGYAQKAIADRADLSAFNDPPTPRILFGLFFMALSYLIGWPAVAFFGFLSIYLREPLIVVIGGPLIYGVSHLMFLAGLYLAGARYSHIFLRWATRKFIEKYSRASSPVRSDQQL